MIIRENLKQQITGPKEIATILQAILAAEHQTDQDKEHFWVIGLNTQKQINYIELATLGILTETQIHPRELYRLAIMRACDTIIIAHNHPSSTTEPSPGDIITTNRLFEAGRILGIAVLDHLIISSDAFYSFKNEGGLPE